MELFEELSNKYHYYNECTSYNQIMSNTQYYLFERHYRNCGGRKMKAINIKRGTDNERIVLPEEIEIPKEILNDEDAMSDYLSDVTGFCHFGFNLSE